MLITVNKEMLLKALGIADAVVSSKNINPFFQTVFSMLKTIVLKLQQLIMK